MRRLCEAQDERTQAAPKPFVITSGTCYQYVREALGNEVSVLKLGMVWPLPVDLIKNFAASVERVVVIEELDGIIEDHCRNIGVKVDGKSIFSPIGEYSQSVIAAAFGIEPKPHVGGAGGDS